MALKDWIKQLVDKGATLRGHIPKYKWVRGYKNSGNDDMIVENFVFTSGKGKNKYFVETWDREIGSKETKGMNKSQALKFARKYMRSH